MQGNCSGRKRDDGIEGSACAVEQILCLTVWHDPAVNIARSPGIKFVEHFAGGIALVKYQPHVGPKRGNALRYHSSAALRENQAHANNISVIGGLAKVIEPKQGKGQTVFDGVRGFVIRDSQNCPVRGSATEDTANIAARER